MFSQKWQARAPRECIKVTSVPNASQAAALVRCTMEHESLSALALIQDVKLEMGGGRPFLMESDGFF